MKKIVTVALDERPCNYEFPYEMFSQGDIEIVKVPFSYMGCKKTPGNIEKIDEFIYQECMDADGLVVSLDTLIYGGIVPSRIHYEEIESMMKRLEILRKIKEKNPRIQIFAFNLIMRCPRYNDDDEEPTYYKDFGANIFKTGFLNHKKELGIISKEELEELSHISVPKEFLEDYLERRRKNKEVTLGALDYIKEGIINYMVIPQDDSAPYGYTAKDQLDIKKKIEEYGIQFKVISYPGADEVGDILTARMVLKLKNLRPLVYVKYPSESCKWIIPSLEDRQLEVSVRYQIIASGCLYTDNIHDCDLVLAVNAPSGYMLPSSHQHVKHEGYTFNRNLVEFIEYINYCIEDLHKPVTICDIGFDNGSDIEFVKMLESKGLTLKLAGYASWNIPCNSLGCALAFGLSTLVNGYEKEWKKFLIHRYLEDFAYCGKIKWEIRAKDCPENGFTIFDVGEKRGVMSEITKRKIMAFIEENLPSIKDLYIIDDIWFPWTRTYEIGLVISLK